MSPPDPLANLLTRCARGDEDAFAQLYRAVAPKLFAVALRILRRRDWAEDVLQDGLFNIWNHAADYDPGKGAPLTWMASIVRYRALDVLRRLRHEVPADKEIEDARPDPAPGPQELTLAGAAAQALAVCMERLSAQQRESITLAYYQGYTHEQLAAALRAPLGTVKTWVRRGLELLKRCLET